MLDRSDTRSLAVDYEAVFSHRGAPYDAAMKRYPRARHIEFENIFRHVERSTLRRVADIPSGSAYLRKYLPATVHVDSYDPCLPFASATPSVMDVDLMSPRLARRDYDLIVSLAAIHHIEDKRTFIRSLIAHTAPQAQIVIADVSAGSKVAAFLDDFVGCYNETGHQGLFLPASQPEKSFGAHERLTRSTREDLSCPWSFDNVGEMVEFSRLLFGMRMVPDDDILAGLNDYIGVEASEDRIKLMWELTYITLTLS